jgi:hypothetical protein
MWLGREDGEIIRMNLSIAKIACLLVTVTFDFI